MGMLLWHCQMIHKVGGLPQGLVLRDAARSGRDLPNRQYFAGGQFNIFRLREFIWIRYSAHPSLIGKYITIELKAIGKDVTISFCCILPSLWKGLGTLDTFMERAVRPKRVSFLASKLRQRIKYMDLTDMKCSYGKCFVFY